MVQASLPRQIWFRLVTLRGSNNGYREGREEVACGNNKVSRGYLSSQPSSTAQQGVRLFNETARAEGKVVLKNSRGRELMVDRKYSYIRRDGSVHYFLDENRNKTLNEKLHVHVRHDEKNGEVHLHITDRRGGGAAQPLHPTTLRAPSGNEVNAAEVRLAAILRDMKSGK